MTPLPSPDHSDTEEKAKRNVDDPARQVCSRESVFLYYDFYVGSKTLMHSEHLGWRPSAESVSHTESINACITSVCCGSTEL